LPIGTDFPFVDDWNPDKRRMVHSVQQVEPDYGALERMQGRS
jgi:hypothetical protein